MTDQITTGWKFIKLWDLALNTLDHQFCVYLVTLYLGQMDPKSKTQIVGMIFGDTGSSVKKAEGRSSILDLLFHLGLVRVLFQQ